MKTIARNEEILKKRISRFFKSSEAGRAELYSLISSLRMAGDVILFGGVLRDIALYGTKKFNSDIDLVIDCSPQSLSDLIKNKSISATQNKFNGYRTEAGGWSIDFWPIESTWAFANNKVTLEGKKSLLNTTITNWDSIIYSFKENKIICSKNYFTDLQSGLLDIILEENPNQIGALIRILKSIYDKNARVITSKTAKYICDELKKWTKEEIIDWQVNQLQKVYFTESDIKELEEKLLHPQADLFGHEILKKGTNFSLL
ncbi:hypothetical protein E0E50_09255 [Azotobacter chroococcum subsp. isscasi]|uniref:hypothetical protein n=1 Tax=Azotobacter chroococcum TaxID=353 RepID=UPI001038DFFC|nr:hypothetical protein [Azotobacter chroococcum]TBW10998.1 hypothetical protein E0E50_09255 [Azotobacter chroococcum subsp. isscasi]